MMRRRITFLVLGLALLLGGGTVMSGLHDFLAITRTVDANVLVVEGWIWESPSMAEAADEFGNGRYRWVLTVGGPVDESAEEGTSPTGADLAAAKLKELGLPAGAVIALPDTTPNPHRTYSSALRVRDWLNRNQAATGVNVFTSGTHARKSLVLFRRALGSEHPLGVIAGTDHTFDARRWWLSGRGIHVLARKTAGYLYAVLWPLPNTAD